MYKYRRHLGNNKIYDPIMSYIIKTRSYEILRLRDTTLYGDLKTVKNIPIIILRLDIIPINVYCNTVT